MLANHDGRRTTSLIHIIDSQPSYYPGQLNRHGERSTETNIRRDQRFGNCCRALTTSEQEEKRFRRWDLVPVSLHAHHGKQVKP